MDRFIQFVKSNKWSVAMGAAGLITVILMFSIGFFRTIVLVVVVAVCALIGYLMDKGGIEAVKSFFRKLFSKDVGA